MQHTRVIVLVRGPADGFPPVLSVCLHLAQMNACVTLAASTIHPATGALLNDAGIGVVPLEKAEYRPGGALAKRALSWTQFHRAAWRLLDAVPRNTPVWIGSADTALALGPKLRRRPYVLQLHELYDRIWRYRLLLRGPARAAASVVAPEAARAAIFRYWYGLDETPFVLPNKPAFHPLRRNMPVEDGEPAAIVAGLGLDAKLVLYQGQIRRAERDLRPIASTVARLGGNWRFVVMGRDDEGYLAELRAVCPDAVHIPFVPPPGHLAITSRARIGVLTYSFTCLNHLFCAPNKIWEYAGFGIPMLCDRLPALSSQVEGPGAGICVDFRDGAAVERAMVELDRDYDRYSERALALYHGVDNAAIVSEILSRL